MEKHDVGYTYNGTPDLKRNEVLTSVATQRNPEDTVLGHIHQTQKDKYFLLLRSKRCPSIRVSLEWSHSTFSPSLAGGLVVTE